MLCGVEDVAVFLIFRKQCVIVSIGFNGDADTLRRGFYAGALPGGGVEPCGTACPGVFAGENSEIAETLC